MTDLTKTIAEWRENGTPGPWGVFAYPLDRFEIGNGVFEGDEFSEYQIATAWGGYDEAPRNAALIAAAPEMAEEIERMRECLQWIVDHEYTPASNMVNVAKQGLGAMTAPTIIMPRHRGHSGAAAWDAEEGQYYGTVTGIRDVVTFISPDLEGLEQAFRDSVDDYLEMIAEESQ